jgi:hypothetical protein
MTGTPSESDSDLERAPTPERPPNTPQRPEPGLGARARELLHKHLGTRTRRILLVISALVFLVLAAVNGIVEETAVRIKNSLLSPNRYVAVVLSERSIDFDIPKEFKTGFDTGMNNQSSISMRGGGSLGIVYREDGGDVDQAARIAKELAADPNCIMVVGNSTSSLTAATLEVFLASQDPPAYVLPIATASDLLVRARDGQHNGVLRMVPDNDSQAKSAARLISSLAKTRRVAVFVDEENPVYSVNLSRAIASAVRDTGGELVVEQRIGPSYPIYEPLRTWGVDGRGSEERFTPESHADGGVDLAATDDKGTARGGTPDVLVYVGVAHHGRLLIDQMTAHHVTTPVIFTDGCMVRSLIKHASERVNAYILSPVQLDEHKNSLVTYEPIGRDAAKLANRLIDECPSCDRQELRELIASRKGAGKLDFTGEAGSYKFSAIGENEGMSYRAYQILPKGEFKDVSALLQ